MNFINLTPIFLVMWPSALFSGNVGKQLAAGTLIVFGMTILSKFKIYIKKDSVSLLILIYFTYCISNILINPLTHDAGSIRDYLEIIRLIGCIIFFLLGYKIGFDRSKDSHIYFLLIILLLLELAFIFDLRFYPLSMYITRESRFSGFAIGVNYVFSIFLFCLLMIKIKSKNQSQNLFFFFLIVMTIFLILSGSRTSLIIFLITLLFLSKLKISYLFNLRFLIFCFLAFFFIRYFEQFDSFNRIEIYVQPFINLSFDIESYPTLLKRFLMWEAKLPLIHERIIFGYGGAKEVLRIIDNSYLMTLLRYGVVGLSLEILLYLTMIRISFKSDHRLLFILYILGHLISGVTTSFLYELKTPYLLFYLFGLILKSYHEQNN